MTDLLWHKPGVRVDERIQQFCAGDDVVLDREFFAFDIQASWAHAQGLQRIGILSASRMATRPSKRGWSSVWAMPDAGTTPAAAATTRCWSPRGCG